MSIPSGTVLRRGDSGSYVRMLQEALVDNNFYPDANASNNGVDGIFGANTEDAVRRYQIINGLTVDGIAGSGTLSSLGLLDGGTGGGTSGTVLRPGHTGDAVRQLQQALVDNNFYPNINAPNNGVDGIYGANTEDAVRRYQIIHGLTVDGIAGSETLNSLGIIDNGGSGGTGSTVLRYGDSGEAVRLLQQALVDNNFYPDINAANYGIDGIFGSNTEDAVRRYQTMHGLTVDGIAGTATFNSLGISGAGSGSSGNGGSYGGTLRLGDRGDAARLLQEALVANNFYPDINAPNYGIDGIYGADTEDAVRRYQIINGLAVDGIAGPATLNSLGLDGGSSGGGSNDGGTGGVDIDFSGGDLDDISISQVFIPITNYNRPGYSMLPRYITIHETANTAPGATAFMHANYVRNASTPTSWHFTVDDSKVIYQHLPTYETGFHAGDGAGDGNRNSIGIELCVNSSGDFSKTRRNAAVLVRKLMLDYQIPIYNVVTHNHWSGKLCPANLLNQFDNFRNQVMNSTLGPDAYNTVTSPFARINEGYEIDPDGNPLKSERTVSYDNSYNVKYGPLNGTLDGSIIFGDPDNAVWNLDINKSGVDVIKANIVNTTVDQVLEMLVDVVPVLGDIAEARTEVEAIIGKDALFQLVEARVSTFDPITDENFPWIKGMEWLSVEVMMEVSKDIYIKEKLAFTSIDWSETDRLKKALVFVLLLVASIYMAAGVAYELVRALVKQLARYGFGVLA